MMKLFLSAVKIIFVCGIALLALPILAAPVKVELVRTTDDETLAVRIDRFAPLTGIDRLQALVKILQLVVGRSLFWGFI